MVSDDFVDNRFWSLIFCFHSTSSFSIADYIFVPMGHFRQQSFCGVSKTVSPSLIDYVVYQTEDGSIINTWGQVVDDGDLETFYRKGDEANINDLKGKMINVSDINSYFFKLLNFFKNNFKLILKIIKKIYFFKKMR